MKLPDPVAWMDRDGDVYKETPELSRAPHQALFTEAQMREALASHEAVMRMALEALTSDEHCNCIPTPLTDEAIKALKEQLK